VLKFLRGHQPVNPPRLRRPAAGVAHHVALFGGRNGTYARKRLLFRANIVQENLIKASSIPYTIIRATQFFEFGKKHRRSFHGGQTKCALPPVRFPAYGSR